MIVIVPIILIMIGLVVGIFSGLIGIGDAIIIIPFLIFYRERISMKHGERASPLYVAPGWHTRYVQLLQSRGTKLKIYTYYCFGFPH